MKTAVLALPSVLDTSLGMTLDILGAANRLRTLAGQSPVFRPVLTSMQGSQVRSGAGLMLGPAVPASRLPRPDLIIVPGANLPLPDEVDAWLASASVSRAVDWLREMARQGAEVTASCAGTFVLAEAGLLDGRSATTTWWLAPHFQKRYPHIALDMNRMVVRDGPVTCAGAGCVPATCCSTSACRKPAMRWSTTWRDNIRWSMRPSGGFAGTWPGRSASASWPRPCMSRRARWRGALPRPPASRPADSSNGCASSKRSI